ncbi:MAG TPA: DUF554 domain-containing protein [Firmicutes bacterium]|nr:DUF554 domain-containing protein [Bacillota bacterium]
MIGIGTIVNALAIIAGAVVGMLIKSGLPKRFKDLIMQAIGLAVIIIGLSGTLQGIFFLDDQGQLGSSHIMLMIFSLVVGGLLGELLEIEKKLEQMGSWVQHKLAAKEGNFAQGFITASLMYCVGAMAIVGALQDGLSANPTILFSKSVLDGVTAVIFAASMGLGVAFSAAPVVLYQGGITLLAGLLRPLLTEAVISQMSLVGSVLIMAIGFNILEIKRMRVGNLLPAVFIPLLYYVITLVIQTFAP